jgi:hypothetical protein
MNRMHMQENTVKAVPVRDEQNAQQNRKKHGEK